MECQSLNFMAETTDNDSTKFTLCCQKGIKSHNNYYNLIFNIYNILKIFKAKLKFNSYMILRLF